MQFGGSAPQHSLNPLGQSRGVQPLPQPALPVGQHSSLTAMSQPPPRAWPHSSPGTHVCSIPRHLLALDVSGLLLLPPASGVEFRIPVGCASWLAWQWKPPETQTLCAPPSHTAQESDTCILQLTGRWQIPDKAFLYPTSLQNR